MGALLCIVMYKQLQDKWQAKKKNSLKQFLLTTIKYWCTHLDSNQEHESYRGSALTVELWVHLSNFCFLFCLFVFGLSSALFLFCGAIILLWRNVTRIYILVGNPNALVAIVAFVSSPALAVCIKPNPRLVALWTLPIVPQCLFSGTIHINNHRHKNNKNYNTCCWGKQGLFTTVIKI